MFCFSILILITFSVSRLFIGRDIADSIHDAVIVVSHSVKALSSYPVLQAISPIIEDYSNVNKSFDKGTVSLIQTDKVPSKRLIYSSTGPVNTDFDDVSRYITAAQKAVKSALSYGSVNPLLIIVPYERFPQAELVGAVGALHSAYTPYHLRNEDGKKHKLETLGLYPLKPLSQPESHLKQVEALQSAFIVTRDIGDGDPQRMVLFTHDR